MNKLQKDYEKACKAYIDRFCEKQDLVFDGWAGLGIGEGAFFSEGELFFNFMDIVWDINSEQPKGLIKTWYYDILWNSSNKRDINYYSYTKGLRKEHFEGKIID